jgi:predicted phosphodiesterase
VLLVRGNADRELVALARGEQIEIPDEVTPWVAAQLTDEHVSLLAGLRLADRRLVINPGSIGMPYGRPGGHWALLRDGAVTLCRTPIDVDLATAILLR